jgi:hypothetical protein
LKRTDWPKAIALAPAGVPRPESLALS